MIRAVRAEEPELFNGYLETSVVNMLKEAVICERRFAEDTLSLGVSGLSLAEMGQYLEYVADRRLEARGIAPIFGSRNPFSFMELQDVQELSNFFERGVSAYQVAVGGQVDLHSDF